MRHVLPESGVGPRLNNESNNLDEDILIRCRSHMRVAGTLGYIFVKNYS